MAYVGKMTDTDGVTGLVGSTLYGTCATAAATVAKVVTLADFDELMTGITIHVKFTNANTASAPTLNVNSTGAKAIYRNGAAVGSGAWQAGQVVSFTYTGSQWETNESGHVVVQSGSTTANYRPIMLGYTNTTTIADLAATTINQVYANTSIFAQPSTGKIFAKEFNALNTNNTPTASLHSGGLWLKSYIEGASATYNYNETVLKTYAGKLKSNNGMLITLQGGGLTIVGGGESATSLANLIDNDQSTDTTETPTAKLDVGGTLDTKFVGDTEQLLLSSDNNIYFITACQTIANRKPVVLDTSSYFYPGTNNTGSIGTSTYKWGSIYATNINGKLYTTATNPSSETLYYIPFITGATSGNYDQLVNDGLGYRSKEGTASAVGFGLICLGNNVASGTAGNKKGYIRMYAASQNYSQIETAATATRALVIPDMSGNFSILNKNSTGYWGLYDGDASMAQWIRTTTNGFIPVEAGGLDNPHSSLGTSTWSFNNAYIANIYTNKIFPASGVYYNNNSGFASAPWAKTVDFTCTTASATRWYAFRVYQAYEGTTIGSGLLIVSITTTADKVYSSGKVVWVYAAGSLDKDNFAVTYTNAASTSTTIEIWAKCTKRYQGWHVVPLYGGWGSGKGDIGINCYSTTTGAAAYTGTLIASEYADIKNNAASADKINTDAGSTKQPVYFTGGVPTVIGYTIEKNVPSNAVFTDTKVNVTLGTTTKAYLLGTSTTPTSTAAAVTSIADTGVYLTTTAGELQATTFKGDLNGTINTATTATTQTKGNNSTKVATTAFVQTAIGDYIPLAGSSAISGDLKMNVTNKGFWLVDTAGNSYPGMKDNNANLWIGAADSNSPHHVGNVYIAAGYNSASSKGNLSINIYTPNAANTKGAATWTVHHTGNLLAGTGLQKDSAASTTYNGTVWTINHSNSVTAVTTTSLMKFKYDAQGHITGSSAVTKSDIPALDYLSNKYAFIIDNESGVASAPWHKFAEMTLTGNYADYDISFYVSKLYISHNSKGILNAHIRTDNNCVLNSTWTRFQWLVVGSEDTTGDTPGMIPDNFVMVCTQNTSSVKIEFWVKIPQRYVSYIFRVLTETDRLSTMDTLSMVVMTASAAGSASYTSGGKNFVSTVGSIQNTAASLSTDAGSNVTPVYFSGGIPVAVNKPDSGAWFSTVPSVGSTGVIDIGRYIDFHSTNAGTTDYDVRLDCSSTSLLTLSSNSGTPALRIAGTLPRLRFTQTTTGKEYDNAGVGIWCQPADRSGVNMFMQSHGNMMISSGEFCSNAYARKDATGQTQVGYDNIVGSTTEKLYLGSDGEVQIISNGQNINTYSNNNHKVWTFGTDGTLTTPGAIKDSLDNQHTMIQQNLRSASNCVALTWWIVDGAASATTRPGIYYHNTGGDSTDKGAIILQPYHSSSNPWDSTHPIGLYIGKGILQLDGTNVSLEGHTHETLTCKSVDATTINNTAGCFFFKGPNLIGGINDWVGIQADAANDKFQLVANGTSLMYRQNDTGGANSANWNDWLGLLAPDRVTTDTYLSVEETTTTLGTGTTAFTYNSGVKISHKAYTAYSSGLYKITVDAAGHVSAATALTITPTPSSKTHTNWDTTAERAYLVTKGWMSYWNGAYNSNNASNLTYCNRGAFGTIVTKSATDYVPNTTDGVNAAINLLTTGTSVPSDDDYYISQYASGGTTTTTYHRRSVKYLWQYMFNKVVATYFNGESGFASAPWAKVASATITTASAHRHIEFLVGQAFRDGTTTTSYFWGILAIRFNTTSSKVYGSGQVEWLVAHENLDKDNIVVTYTNVASTSTTIEIWAKTTVRYCGYTFRSLTGLGLGLNSTILTDWNFYDPTSGVATYTGTLIASSYSDLKNNAISATTASKLGSATVGGTGLPIYLSSGTATACSVPASGAWWNTSHILVPQISTAGVLEIGRYVDFHSTAASTANYTIRLDNASTTSLRFSEVNTTAGANFSPATTAKYDLGTSSLKWRYIYGDLNGGINITAATDGTYYVPFISSTSGYNTLSSNTDISFETSRGDTSSTGLSLLGLGNSTAEGSNGNAYGALKLYGLGSNYISLTAKNVTGSNKEIKLPNYAGTVMITGIGDALTSTNSIDADTKDITKHWYVINGATSAQISDSPAGSNYGYHIFNIPTTAADNKYQKQLLFGNTSVIPYMYRYLANGTWSGGWRSPGTGFFYVLGTQNAKTKMWTGNLPIPQLYDGLTIAFYLPYDVVTSQNSTVWDASSNTNVWLQLTLSNGQKTDWVPCYWTNQSRITTHFSSGATILLTYWSTPKINGANAAAPVSKQEGGKTVYWPSIARWTRADYNSNSDTKVNVTLGTTTKAYLLGTSTTPTSTAAAVTSIADTGVYLDTTAGSLTATKFTVNNLIEIHDTSYTSRSVRLTYGSTASGTSIQHFPTCDGEIQVSQGQAILYSGTVNLTSTSGTDITISGDYYLEDFRMLLFEMYPPSGDGAHHIVAPWNYVHSQSPTVIWFQAVPEQNTSHMSTKSNFSVGVSYGANGKIHITPGTGVTGTWGIRIYSLI